MAAPGTALLAGLASAAAQDALRPLKPAVGPDLWLPALLFLALVLVALGVAARLRRRLAARSAARGTRAPAAAGTLRARLERIRDAGWIEHDAHLQACEAIAEVMRDLVRTRWVVTPGRLTTAELLGELAGRGAETGLTRPLSDVLGACDLVKFAGASLRAEDLRGHLETALLLVDVYGGAGDEGPASGEEPPSGEPPSGDPASAAAEPAVR